MNNRFLTNALDNFRTWNPLGLFNGGGSTRESKHQGSKRPQGRSRKIDRRQRAQIAKSKRCNPVYRLAKRRGHGGRPASMR